jgi:nitroimidazol reductase NimA-like FMN-containing flavoprotein (pyridoxamine 5'-phosphate oxidase superfamily)
MKTETPTVEQLDGDECWVLLRPRHLGRIAFFGDGGAEVQPVNYLVDDDTIVFRTDIGLKWSVAVAGDRITFEVDEANADLRTGWSVVVKGRAEEVLDPAQLDRLRRLPLRPWTGGDKRHWLRLHPTKISGRRVVLRPAHDRSQ